MKPASLRRRSALLALPLCVITTRAQTAVPVPSPSIALTFDDLPAHGSLPIGTTRVAIATAVIDALHQAGAPPIYGFVNAVDLEHHPEDTAVLDLWRKAGNPLGNHTWSHINLNDHTPEDFEAEIEKNEPVLRDHAGTTDWHWFRFPFLAEGNTPEKKAAIRSFLASRGYRIAAVTMSFGDYEWNEPYARCLAKHDKAAIASLEQTYLKAAAEDLTYRHALSVAATGRDIPYVLLMHIGAFDARMLPRLLDLYRSQGIRLITLQQAESDPFYANDIDLTLPGTPDSLEAALATRHLPQPPHPTTAPDPKLCR